MNVSTSPPGERSPLPILDRLLPRKRGIRRDASVKDREGSVVLPDHLVGLGQENAEPEAVGVLVVEDVLEQNGRLVDVFSMSHEDDRQSPAQVLLVSCFKGSSVGCLSALEVVEVRVRVAEKTLDVEAGPQRRVARASVAADRSRISFF